MKHVLLILILITCKIAFTQNDGNISRDYSHFMNHELKNLYEKERELENETPDIINANRMAIKNAWMQINPEIGNLYKPLENNGKLPEIIENVDINGLISTNHDTPRKKETDNQVQWATDVLIHDGFVDGGVGSAVDNLGHIYTSHYESFDTTHIIYIYRSINQGDSWELFRSQIITAPILKLQLVSIHGSGDNYILAYFLTSTNVFQVIRWKTAVNEPVTAQVVSTEVIDFSLDRNYPINTAAQRVFAIYKKTTNDFVRSARSTAGSFGLDWVDESESLIRLNMVDFAYGLNGSCYGIGVGQTTLNLISIINTNFNDPASWAATLIVQLGSNRESINPKITASRLAIANDNVLVACSTRTVGSTGKYDLSFYRRLNDNEFTHQFTTNTGTANISLTHPDMFVRFENNITTIKGCFNRVDNDGPIRANRIFTSTGSTIGDWDDVSDAGINPFSGFKSSVIRELNTNNESYLIFTGTHINGSFGRNLYFDKQIALSSQNIPLPNVLFYPNPTNDFVNIASIDSIEQIEVYNQLGQLVINQKTNEYSIKVSFEGFKTGVYFIKVSSGEKTSTHKIMKN